MAVVNTEISMKFSTLISQNTVVVELAPESDETALDLLLIQRTGVLRVEGPSYLSQLQAKYQKKDQKVVPLGESIVGRAEQDIILEDLDAEVFQESGIGASELDTDNIQVLLFQSIFMFTKSRNTFSSRLIISLRKNGRSTLIMCPVGLASRVE